MAAKRYRYPITSHMVLQSRHDIMVRAAENKADSGGSRPRDKRSILDDSGTIVEKALQGEVELHRGKRGGGGRRVDVLIEDIGEEASVSAARIDAAMHVRLTVGAARDAAAECRLADLQRMLSFESGERRLGGMLDERHAHVHSLSHSIPDEVAACLTTDAVLVAIYDGRPADMVALRLVEGSHMDMAGRVGDAAAAYEDALRRCLAHIKKEPESVWAHLCAGHSLAHLGRAGEAEAMLREAARLDPASPLAHLELGHLARLAGCHADAARLYARSIELDPTYAPARVFRGYALRMQKGPDGRLEVAEYNGALVVDPHDVSAHVALGLSLSEEGRHGEAAGHFEEAIRIDPDDAASYVALGHARAAGGRDAEAGAAYEGAIDAGARTGLGLAASGVRIDRASRIRYRLGGASAHLGLAGVLSRAGRHEKALAYYRDAIDLDGGSTEAHAGAGGMLAILGRWEESIPAYRRASELDPRSAKAHIGLAEALLSAGRHEEAVPAYRRASELDPGSSGIQIGLAEALLSAGRHEDAARAYRRASELDPGSSGIQIGLAEALLSAGRHEDAALAYRRASELDPGSSGIQIGLAEALSDAGRHEDAARAYRRASELDPGSARAHLGLADALSITGWNTEAQRAYDRAVEIDPDIERKRYGEPGAWGE